jgi:DNA helicase II / ATP-dependent DNA helicase PcrA
MTALDIYQSEAVYSQEKNLLVVAAPGSGKTTVIINRVAYLVNKLKVNPDNIVVITFTKSAALNMKRRYEAMNEGQRPPFFGTFHALFYKILRRHCGEINIIEGTEAYKVIKNVLLKYLDEISEDKIRELLNGISRFKCSDSSMHHFNPDVDKNIFIECYETYEEFKRNRNLMDFDDLQIKCRNLFLERQEILQGYIRLFNHILVDEFQDCDGLQLQLLRMLNQGGSLFAVGDEDQCIYGFRGSRPECMVNFHEMFAGGKKLFLLYNYRSPENVIETSRQLIGNNIMRNVKSIKASRKDLRDIQLAYNINESLQAEELAGTIEKLRASGCCSYRDNAVLYRTNVESRSVIDVFIRKRIPFKLLDREYNFFEHFICKDILSYLALSLDASDRNCFSKIINKPFRYVSKLNIERVMSYRFKENCFDILSNLEELPIFQVKVIKDLKKDIHYLNKMSLRSAVDFIIMDIGYIEYLREYSGKFKIDMNELEEVLEEFKEACSQFSTISALLYHVEEVKREIKKNEKNDNEDYVVLSTIHGVKGMEFANVFIINCVEDNMPHINSIPNNLEEERRLFYVGITRTKENLFLFSPKTIRGKSKEASRFIKECRLDLRKEVNCGYTNGDMVEHDVFGRGQISSINGKEIDIKFDNGVTRKFDVLILINGRLLRKI